MNRYLKRICHTALYLLIIAVYSNLMASTVSIDESEQVCHNWLNLMTERENGWAEDYNPEILEVDEIIIDSNLLGYCYHISPSGFVVVPAIKELPPVMFYSQISTLDDPDIDQMYQLISDVLTDRIEYYTKQYGSLDASLPSISTYDQWEDLLTYQQTFRKTIMPEYISNSVTTGPLLTTQWNQGYPYNKLCPQGDGSQCWAGCVATATAQIMNYWQWPENGRGEHSYYWDGDESCDGSSPGETLYADFTDNYDWENMPDKYTGNWSEEETDAVSELLYEVGIAANMNYGVCGSAAYLLPEPLTTRFRYSFDAKRLFKEDYDPFDWFDTINNEINMSRPVLYCIPNHALVCDGSKISLFIRYLHLNYGWGGSHDAWYALDNIYYTTPDEYSEYAVIGIEPWVSHPDDIYWSKVNFPFNSQYTAISEITSFNNSLIVAADFNPDPNICSRRIATYDGIDWLFLTPEFEGVCYEFITFNDKLFACGTFTNIGELTVNGIAEWDGSSWSALGDGFNLDDTISSTLKVSELTVYNGKLIAIGNFTHSGDIAVKNIAVWDGESWSPLSTNPDTQNHISLQDIIVYNEELIASGKFRDFSGELDGSDTIWQGIANWNGTHWLPLDDGITDSTVYLLSTYKDNLIASGWFTKCGKAEGANIVSWDGNEWKTLGDGTDDIIIYTTEYNDKLIAGGRFLKAGEGKANRIAMWDGSEWSALGSGANDLVLNLTVNDNCLYISGWFSVAGDCFSPEIAKWDPMMTSVDEEITELPGNPSISRNFPNPFNPKTTIEFDVPRQAHVIIDIYNILGQKICTLVNETKPAGSYQVEWNGIDDKGNSVATGIYMYRFKAGDYIQSEKMLLLK